MSAPRQHRPFETSTPYVKPCPRCRRPLVQGLAEGVPVRVDPTPIDPADEVLAVAAGRSTYTLRRTGLIYRDDDRRADPELAAPVLEAHRCPGRPS